MLANKHKIDVKFLTFNSRIPTRFRVGAAPSIIGDYVIFRRIHLQLLIEQDKNTAVFGISFAFSGWLYVYTTKQYSSIIALSGISDELVNSILFKHNQ